MIDNFETEYKTDYLTSTIDKMVIYSTTQLNTVYLLSIFQKKIEKSFVN